MFPVGRITRCATDLGQVTEAKGRLGFGESEINTPIDDRFRARLQIPIDESLLSTSNGLMIPGMSIRMRTIVWMALLGLWRVRRCPKMRR